MTKRGCYFQRFITFWWWQTSVWNVKICWKGIHRRATLNFMRQLHCSFERARLRTSTLSVKMAKVCKRNVSQSSSGCREKPIIPLPEVKTSVSSLLRRSSPPKFSSLLLLISPASPLHSDSFPLWSPAMFKTVSFPGDEAPLCTALAGERHSSERDLRSSKLFRSGFCSSRLVWSYFGDLFSLDGVTCFL